MNGQPWLEKIKNWRWLDALLVVALILFDVAVHPLGIGPDRLIHDPAVYRLANSHYLPGDWYTAMAVKSGIYTFYAHLVNFHSFLHLSEELWRQILYLGGLAILYYALIRIARLFTKNILVVPVLVVLHYLLVTGINQPLWLYGPFIQIDGGLAPRTIGIALSFLALFFLLNESLNWMAILLGVATLVHVSNSFIIFSLFLAAWLIRDWLGHLSFKGWWQRTGRKTAIAVGLYLLFGGWFALWVAHLGSGGATIETQKFIWGWIYVRAPYMALPLAGRYWWVRLWAHALAIVVGWLLVRWKLDDRARKALDTVALIGLGSVGYFYLFDYFAFIKPWLPGFQFYSIRVIYLCYFTAYLFIGLSIAVYLDIVLKFIRQRLNPQAYLAFLALLIVATTGLIISSPANQTFQLTASTNVQASRYWLLQSAGAQAKDIPRKYQVGPPTTALFKYLQSHGQPVLTPPTWNTGAYYISRVVSFKSFGYTPQGMADWLERLNAVTAGVFDQAYAKQKAAGRFEPTNPEWHQLYASLTPEQVLALGQKYQFKLFLSYQDSNYPFPFIVGDGDFKLYQLP
ncbi:MAG TPA: hypothetical protein VLE93_00095 [Candidatus Saccharimonadales bacterium]|nr:hypothetical protein [Candidatus Saccharimonadales bacterium]